MKHRIFERDCEVCGKQFRRSAPVDTPPRFCGRDCLYHSRCGQRYEKYVIPEEWHDIIRKTYQTGTGKGEVAKLARKIGVPRTRITNLARNNGWIPKKYSADWDYFWCDAEISTLERNAHYAPITIARKLKAKGFRRSVGAVEIKLAELRARQNLEGMSANSLGECMGIDMHSVLTAIQRGYLKAERRPGFEGDNAAYYILPKDVKKWITDRLPEIDIRKCDKYWLVDILTGGA